MSKKPSPQPPLDDVDLLRKVYRHLDRDALLRDCPGLTESEIKAFFRRLAERLGPRKAAAANAAPEGPPCESVVLYTDGGSRGNPGPAGLGAVLTNRSGTVLAELSVFIGRATNNEAEYRGLIEGLQAARAHGVRDILVRSDSELLIHQINGAYKVKSARLKPLFAEARALLSSFGQWRAEHVRRERNTHADRLANEAMDRGAADRAS